MTFPEPWVKASDFHVGERWETASSTQAWLITKVTADKVYAILGESQGSHPINLNRGDWKLVGAAPVPVSAETESPTKLELKVLKRRERSTDVVDYRSDMRDSMPDTPDGFRIGGPMKPSDTEEDWDDEDDEDWDDE